MRKVLLVSFEPFGGELRNPAWDILSTFTFSEVINASIAKIVLPCTFSDSRLILLNRLEKECFDIIIIFAQAGGRFEINIERVAINVIDSPIPDNNNIQIIDESIEANGANAYFSTIPVKEIVRKLKNNNIPSCVSNNAGTFLCNYIFYSSLHFIESMKKETKVGVVHIPYIPEQVLYRPGVPCMSEDIIERALSHIVISSLN
ncbi:pyroglutamyl-peptidase I [Serratia fonticola]|uniref:Pyrrolidone-carboxylate peptidase n=1 Tax=Serratia fonticola TaxID=47917 RepID=A0AAW3WPG6_SERFO|nr:pyroglutamyl-peptidase I [Serratia fonticola]MBC3212441.1 pyroglutamyl-peptidase I [Serratia fonticola]NYA12979.1 pyroglutamyl-peptidase I [Serratia fonticola]NYA32557.1 pyroglutamyl-peptidase I [Serratia fonticola]